MTFFGGETPATGAACAKFLLGTVLKMTAKEPEIVARWLVAGPLEKEYNDANWLSPL